MQLAAFDPEEIRARCLGDFAKGVQQKRVIGSSGLGLGAGEDMKEFVRGFAGGECIPGGHAQ